MINFVSLINLESDIQQIIENSDDLKKIVNNPYDIQLWNRSDNLTFKIIGKATIIAKVGLTGWAKHEFETLTLLARKNYAVPKPIKYIQLEKHLDEKWNFGNMNREVGVLFYFPLNGKNLKQNLTHFNIFNGLNFLKKIHEDISLRSEIIKDYQKVEVNRGLGYIERIFKGDLEEDLVEMIGKYQDYEIDFCFIHGGPRLEHFIVNDSKIWMIDFESACMGDRFKDLGIFFIELALNGFEKPEFIQAYFQRDLRRNEEERLKFFELRALLVKMAFEPRQDILNRIKEAICDN